MDPARRPRPRPSVLLETAVAWGSGAPLLAATELTLWRTGAALLDPATPPAVFWSCLGVLLGSAPLLLVCGLIVTVPLRGRRTGQAGPDRPPGRVE